MSHRRCAFLTMDSTEGWSIDADLAIAPLEVRGWTVDQVPWRSPDVDWNAFDAVYFGTPWDYPQDVNRFIDVLERIDRSRAVLVNDLALVKWGLPKTYLRDLEKRGADIVPSYWQTHLEKDDLAALFDRIMAETGVSPEPALVETADRVLALVSPMPVYARCDLVRGPDGRFLLMELELIEPSMYLRMHTDAPERFAAAFDQYVSSAT
jgi:hypothetical protein